MSPFQHGEVFVTDDGAETDLDLGHYERFITTRMKRATTSPPARSTSRAREGAPRRLPRQDRAGHPAHHRRDQGIHQARRRRTWTDVAIVEIGGTVGDIESLPFLEAIRQMGLKGPQQHRFMHLTCVPYIADRRRAEDQADPALGAGAARDRHPARRPAVPRRPPIPEDDERRKIALFRAGGALAQRAARRDRRAEGSPVVRRLPVPPGVQKPPRQAASPLPGLYRGRAPISGIKEARRNGFSPFRRAVLFCIPMCAILYPLRGGRTCLSERSRPFPAGAPSNTHTDIHERVRLRGTAGGRERAR
jgi:hypothetical protein